MTAIKRWELALGVIAVATVLGGCTTRPVKSHPWTKVPNGVTGPVYYLPRTEFEVKIVFEAFVKKPMAASGAVDLGGGTSENPAKVAFFVADVDSPITLNVYQVADLKHPIQLTLNDDFLADTKYEVDLSEAGLLTAVNSEIDDKSQSVISNTVGSLASAALLVAKSTTSEQWLKTGVRYTLTERFSARRLVVDGKSTGGASCDVLKSAITKMAEANSDPRLVAVVGFHTVERPPAVKLHVVENADQIQAGGDDPSADVAGIYYRLPNQQLVELSVDGSAAAVYKVAIEDNAPLAVYPLEGRRFSQRSDKLTFAASGVPTAFVRNGTSAGDAAAQSLKATTDAVSTFMTSLKTQQTTAAAAQATTTTADYTKQWTLAGLQAQQQVLQSQIAVKQHEVNNAAPADLPAKQQELITLQGQLAQLQVKISAVQAGVTIPGS